MHGRADEEVSEISRGRDIIIENKKKDIFIPIAEGDSASEISNTQPVDALEVARMRMKDITENVSNILQVGQAVVDSLRPAFEALRNMVIKADQFATAMKPMLDVIQQISTSFVETIANISIPIFSEEERQKLLESHCQWGRLGWTWFQDAPMNFYDNPPTDMKDASVKVRHLCTMQGMESIFSQLREQKINHEDLESAIFCFRNKQYKACALMLFGLIDAKLIRVQSKNKGKRKVGAGAVRQLKTQFEANKNEQVFYTMLFCSNLFACLETIFAYGNDFKDEPNTINRNFVDHGMNHSRIRKRDCVQLFLVLNNLMYFLSDDIILLSS